MKKIYKYVALLLCILSICGCGKKKVIEIEVRDTEVQYTGNGQLKITSFTTDKKGNKQQVASKTLDKNYEYKVVRGTPKLTITGETEDSFELTTVDDIAYAKGNNPYTKGNQTVRRQLEEFKQYDNMYYFNANNGTACKAYVEVGKRKESKHTYVYMLANKNTTKVDVNIMASRFLQEMNEYKDILDEPKTITVCGKSIEAKNHTLTIISDYLKIDDICLISAKPLNKYTSEQESFDKPFKTKGKWCYYKYKNMYIKANKDLQLNTILR